MWYQVIRVTFHFLQVIDFSHIVRTLYKKCRNREKDRQPLMSKSKICFFFQTKLLLIIVCVGSVKYQSYFFRLLTIVDFGTDMPRYVACQLSTLALYRRLSICVFMWQFYWLCMAVEVPLNKYVWLKSTVVEVGRTRVNITFQAESTTKVLTES